MRFASIVEIPNHYNLNLILFYICTVECCLEGFCRTDPPSVPLPRILVKQTGQHDHKRSGTRGHRPLLARAQTSVQNPHLQTRRILLRQHIRSFMDTLGKYIHIERRKQDPSISRTTTGKTAGLIPRTASCGREGRQREESTPNRGISIIP